MTYRYLIDGETLNIGDEFFQDGKWTKLNEEEYEKWVSFRHKYDSSEMCKFRRKLVQNETDVSLSHEILNSTFKKAMPPISGV